MRTHHWLRLAMQGNVDAQYHLALEYLYGDETGRKDEREAAHWLTKASEQGHIEAQKLLAALYYDGLGVPKSLELTYYWNKRAADQGDISAMAFLGVMHVAGEGVAQDDNKALEYLLPAAKRGHAIAQEQLGDMYLKGKIGGQRQLDEALYWFEQAAAQGRESAKKRAELIRQWKAQQALESESEGDELKTERKETIEDQTQPRLEAVIPEMEQTIAQYSTRRIDDIRANAEGRCSSLLVHAAANGYIGMMRSALQHGVSVQEKEYDGTTALEAAAASGHTETVRLLLDASAKVNYRSDHHMETPLMLAALNGHHEIVELLLERGADPKLVGSYGNALLYATVSNQKEIARMLIRRGVHVNMPGQHRVTALHVASYKGYFNIVMMLLKAGADVSAVAHGAWTPLLLAVWKRKVKCARALLEYEADPNDRLPTGQTALMLAAERGSVELVRLLCSYGADASARDHNGKTALSYVRGNTEISRIIYFGG
jgi:TPR repeat protein